MDHMNRLLTSLPVPQRLRDAGWGVLLLPVALLIVAIFGRGVPLAVTAALAAAATLLVPAVAADLVATGVMFLGLYATFLTGWMILAFFQVIGNDFSALYSGLGLFAFNPYSDWFITATGSGVVRDVMTSALIMAFGVWLVPRTIGVHAGLVQRNAALTRRVTRLAETRGTAVDSAAAELRRLERDLHDGAQARLVALGINLRAAEHLFKTNPDAALAPRPGS